MVSVSTRKIEEMREVAYRPEEIGMDAEYLAYIVVRNPGQNITITPQYRLGGNEYPKTYGHYHRPGYPETYRVFSGKAGFLIQRLEGGQVAEITLKIVTAGEEFTVPEGYAHVSMNLGNGYLVTLDDHDPAHFENDYGPIKEHRGLGYYILDKEGEIEAIPNPAYGKLPPLKIDG